MTQNQQQYLNYVRHIASLFAGEQQPEAPIVQPVRRPVQRLISLLKIDAELVLDNAFSELQGHELEVCQDRDGSAQLEVLLHHSHVTHLTALVEPLLQSANIDTWFELMSNVFASHVIDAVFNQLQRCMTDYHVTDAEYQPGLNLVRQIVVCMTNTEHRTALAVHWRQLLTSKYGSYTLRHTYALVHALLKHATKKGNRKAMTALTNHLSALLTALTWSTDSKYLIDMCHHEATAHVIELVLEIAAESGAQITRENHVSESGYLWLVDTLLSAESSAEEEHVTDIQKRMKHAVWSHVMIAIIKHVTALKNNQKWNWSVLYQKYFRTRLVALCAHPVANFVVQTLIATSSTEPHWRMVFTEIEPQFSELLDGRLGVVLNLLNSSVTHVNTQAELVKAVVKVLSSLSAKEAAAKNGKEPDSNALVQETRKQIASVLLHLKNAPRHQYKKQARDGGDGAAKNSFGQYSGIGCQLLSALFQLQHENQFVLKSFTQLGKDEHVKMCKDQQASHVIDHFLNSRHVPLAFKQNFIESLKGCFAELAQDKYGSHCVDKCYQNSELSKKEMITKELLKNERELNASFYGKHVLKNCRAEQYKKKRDVWRSKEQQNEKTRERFADILAAPTEDEHVEEHVTKDAEHVPETTAAPNTESRGTKRKRKESTGVKEESVTGVKEESAEDDIDRVFKKIKPNPRDDDEHEEVTLTPVIQESAVSDTRLDNIVAALKKTKSKSKKK